MSKHVRMMLFLLPLVAFIALAVLLFNRNGEDPSVLPSARVGQNLPSFEMASLTEPGRMLTPKDLAGEVSLLNVWATWCVSCLVEHPVLMELAASGIPIYGVNYKDSPEAALMYLANNGDPFRFSMSDVTGSLGLDLGVYGAPETYLLDREGRIRYRSVGVLDARSWIDELEPRYRALVEEVAP